MHDFNAHNVHPRVFHWASRGSWPGDTRGSPSCLGVARHTNKYMNFYQTPGPPITIVILNIHQFKGSGMECSGMLGSKNRNSSPSKGSLHVYLCLMYTSNAGSYKCGVHHQRTTICCVVLLPASSHAHVSSSESSPSPTSLSGPIIPPPPNPFEMLEKP